MPPFECGRSESSTRTATTLTGSLLAGLLRVAARSHPCVASSQAVCTALSRDECTKCRANVARTCRSWASSTRPSFTENLPGCSPRKIAPTSN
eukprot:5917226-Prymnesium_polylepis.1